MDRTTTTGDHRKPHTFEEALQSIFEEAYDLMLDRRSAYGTSNIEEQGETGVFTRIAHDKLARIRRYIELKELDRLMRKFDVVADDGGVLREHARNVAEGVEDDLLDIINYCAIFLALRRNWWGLDDANTAESGEAIER